MNTSGGDTKGGGPGGQGQGAGGQGGHAGEGREILAAKAGPGAGVEEEVEGEALLEDLHEAELDLEQQGEVEYEVAEKAL